LKTPGDVPGSQKIRGKRQRIISPKTKKVPISSEIEIHLRNAMKKLQSDLTTMGDKLEELEQRVTNIEVPSSARSSMGSSERSGLSSVGETDRLVVADTPVSKQGL
jgi:hypothetical protein